MVDKTYHLRVLRHKFAKATTERNPAPATSTILLSGAIGTAGTYRILDKWENSAITEHAPAIVEKINRDFNELKN